MTEIAFHFNVPERSSHVCRLVRKVVRLGSGVVITGPAPALSALDRALWVFDDLAFIAHVYLRPGETAAARMLPTPVWLSGDALQPGRHDVLVNLGDEPPAGYESFAKVVEVVSTDETERLAARSRWKHYASRGYQITRHEITA